jgi:hypothetical protein
MIRGKITTFKTADGGTLYRGVCVVRNESVTAGEVMSQQIPAGPAKGYVRSTLRWVDTQDADGSRCEFEIHDAKQG